MKNRFTSDVDLLYIKYCLANNHIIYESKLTYDHFNDVLAKVLFQIMARCIIEKNCFLPKVDLVDLFNDKDRLEKYSHFDHPIVLSTIDNLLEDFEKMATDLAASQLEKTILDRYNREKLAEINSYLYNDIKDSSKSSSELLRKYSFMIDELLSNSSENRITLTSNEMLQKELDFLNSPNEETYAKTGTIIDIANGGLTSPSLTIILGAPKAGKSISLYNIALNSLEQKRKVLFVTIEISTNEAARKILSIYSQVPFSSINKKELTTDEEKQYLQKIKEFQDMTKDSFFIIDDLDGISPKDVEVYCNKLKRAGIIIDDIVIDYMQILNPNDPKATRIDAQTLMSQELRKLSQKTSTRVFSAAQLHSSVNEKEFKDINYHDVYYSKSLSQDVTYCLAIEQVKRGDEKPPLFRQKFLPSRQIWDDHIYVYPNYTPETLTLGKPELDINDDKHADTALEQMLSMLGEVKKYDWEE